MGVVLYFLVFMKFGFFPTASLLIVVVFVVVPGVAIIVWDHQLHRLVNNEWIREVSTPEYPNEDFFGMSGDIGKSNESRILLQERVAK